MIITLIAVLLVLVVGSLTRSIIIKALKDTVIAGGIVGTLIWMTGRFVPEDPKPLIDHVLKNFSEFYHLVKVPGGFLVVLYCLSLMVRWHRGKTPSDDARLRQTSGTSEKGAESFDYSYRPSRNDQVSCISCKKLLVQGSYFCPYTCHHSLSTILS